MAWPRGKSRKEYFAQKRAAETAAKEVMPPEHSVPEQPASQPEVRAPRQRYQVSDAARVAHASMKAGPKAPEWKMKAGNNWENAEIVDENPDRYHIPRDQFPPGMALQWITVEIYGQPQFQRVNAFKRGGWTPVHREDFDGRYAYRPCDNDGYIMDGGMMLAARPEEMDMAAKEREKAKAREQIAIKEQAFTGGGINATGADHPSAVGQNRINRTIERIEIPKE